MVVNQTRDSFFAGNLNPGAVIRKVRTDFDNQMNKWVTFSSREMITTITASNLFTKQAVAVNPGQTSLCLWMAQLAVAYEEFYPIKLRFKWHSLCNNASTELSTGAVAMMLDYDCTDLGPDSFNTMQVGANKIWFKPQRDDDRKSKQAHLDFNVSLCQQKRYYTLADHESVENDSDVHDYLPAMFYVGVTGCPTNFEGATIGQIELEAIFKFKAPRKEIAGDILGSYSATTSTPTSAAPLGTSKWNMTPGSTDYFEWLSGTEIKVKTNIPKGSVWHISLCYTHASGAVTGPLPSVLLGDLIPYWPTGTPLNYTGTYSRTPSAASTASSMCVQYLYKVPETGLPEYDVITMSGATLPTVNNMLFLANAIRRSILSVGSGGVVKLGPSIKSQRLKQIKVEKKIEMLEAKLARYEKLLPIKETDEIEEISVKKSSEYDVL